VSAGLGQRPPKIIGGGESRGNATVVRGGVYVRRRGVLRFLSVGSSRRIDAAASRPAARIDRCRVTGVRDQNVRTVPAVFVGGVRAVRRGGHGRGHVARSSNGRVYNAIELN